MVPFGITDAINRINRGRTIDVAKSDYTQTCFRRTLQKLFEMGAVTKIETEHSLVYQRARRVKRVHYNRGQYEVFTA